MKTYGLIGNPVAHSFSEKYFSEKFEKEEINAEYKLFKLEDLTEFQDLLKKEKNLKGLNVTSPFKEKIFPFLDEIEEQAQNIGAVNTIKFEDGRRIGYNTDSFGFLKSLFPIIEKQYTDALILGTGGAAKAIAQALKSMGIDYQMVSRTPAENQIAYTDLTAEIIKENLLIVNCTPLGTYPNVEESPNIPYEGLTKKHLLYDLTYNPVVTQFLAQGQMRECKVFNGQKMLEFQAERSWEIWNEK